MAEVTEDTTKLEENKDRESAQVSSSLDKLTDHVEERELDEKKVQKAMAALTAAQAADREAERLRERELAAVKIDKEHVDILAGEYEIDKKQAERRLREHKGDIIAALESYL